MAPVKSIPKTTLLVLVLFLVNALLILAEYSVLFAYHRPPEWISVVRYGVFAGQLFVVSFVGALAEKRRWAMWLSVLPFVLLLTLGILPEGDRNWLRLLWYIIEKFDNVLFVSGQLLVLLFANSIAPLFMMLAGILLLSVIFWPVKVFMGWRMIGRDGSEPDANKVSTWQLMLWVGLWSTLFFIYTQVREFFGTDWLVAAWMAVPVVLIAGFPVAIGCAGPRIRWYSWLAIPAYVLALSYGESELSYFIASLTPRGGTGIQLVYPLCLNATIACVVAANLTIMRAFGLRLHTPFRRRKKPATESPAVVDNRGVSTSDSAGIRP